MWVSTTGVFTLQKKFWMGFTKKIKQKKVEPDYGISYNQLPKITQHLSIQINKHIISSNHHLILIKRNHKLILLYHWLEDAYRRYAWNKFWMGFTTKIKQKNSWTWLWHLIQSITENNSSSLCPNKKAYNQFKSAFNLNQMKSQFDHPLPLTRGGIYA